MIKQITINMGKSLPAVITTVKQIVYDLQDDETLTLQIGTMGIAISENTIDMTAYVRSGRNTDSVQGMDAIADHLEQAGFGRYWLSEVKRKIEWNLVFRAYDSETDFQAAMFGLCAFLKNLALKLHGSERDEIMESAEYRKAVSDAVCDLKTIYATKTELPD